MKPAKKSSLTRFLALTSLASVCLLAAPTSALAAVMSDNRDDPAYSDGWAVGDNGGTGLGQWTSLTDTFLGASDANGSGTNAGATDIDSPVSGQSWGLLGDGGTAAEAFRSLTFVVGETFSLGFDGGFTNNGQAAGFGLRSGTTNILEFFQFGGQNYYSFNAPGGSGIQTTNGLHAFTDDGMVVTFTLTSNTTWTGSVTFLDDASTDNFGGTMADISANPIDTLRLFNFSSSGNPAGNAYYNNLTVVPEPTTFAMLFGGVGMLTLFGRRRA